MSERSHRLDVSLAAAVIAQQVGGKIVRDALFLASFTPASLPPLLMAAALLSLACVGLSSRAMARYGPARVVPAAFVLGGVACALEWAFAARAPALVAVSIYLHTSALSGLMISGFWSIVNERFDPRRARRHIVRVTTGATLGGLLGGIGAARLGAWAGPRAILLVLAALSIGCAWGLARTTLSAARAPAAAVGALREGMAQPYLRRVAALVLVIALVEVLLDCALKSVAAGSVHDERSLVSFFAVFHTAVGVGTFLVQIALSRMCLEGLGLGGTLAILPGALALACLGAAYHPGLVPIALASGLEMALASSLFRSAYEILYTPVPAARKRALKVMIDVAVPRLGTIAGSGLVALLWATTWQSGRVLLLAVSASCAFALAQGRRLHRLYVSELATSLQLGLVSMSEADALDATTRHTIATTTVLDRGRLLAAIDAQREPGGAQAALFDSLLLGLEDRDFDVRHANARALAAMCERSPALAPDRARVLAWARAALAADPVWTERPRRGLEHVFLLLGLTFERALVKDCLAALSGADPTLSGTALEVLDNVLPGDLGELLRAKLAMLGRETLP